MDKEDEIFEKEDAKVKVVKEKKPLSTERLEKLRNQLVLAREARLAKKNKNKEEVAVKEEPIAVKEESVKEQPVKEPIKEPVKEKVLLYLLQNLLLYLLQNLLQLQSLNQLLLLINLLHIH